MKGWSKLQQSVLSVEWHARTMRQGVPGKHPYTVLHLREVEDALRQALVQLEYARLAWEEDR